MTAPLFNLPITSPITGPSTPTAAQGPMAGFEALLAAFFGEPGEQAAGGLFGEDKTADEDAALQPGMADGPSTPPLSAEGQVLAAMLAGAPAQTVQAAPDAAETAADGQFTGGAAASPTVPFQPPAPSIATGASAPQAPLQQNLPAGPQTAPLTADADPQSDLAGLAQSEAQALVAAAATDPQAARPATAQAADAKSPAVAPHPTNPGPAATSSARQPAVQAPPPAPIEPPAATQAMAQAEVLAAAPVEAEPVQPHPPQRNAKSAEAARRGEAHAAAAPAAPMDDALSPTAVAPVTNASASGEPASSIETETLAPAREAKTEAAPDAPDFQAPAPAAATAHAAAPAAHAAPVRATSETVANLTAQISKHLEGQSTKFEVELNPAGLGRVSVSVEIAASGKMTAAMSFDSPQAAAELRARSNDLQRALEQAGFDLSGGLSFDVAGDHGEGRGAPQQQQNDGAAWRGRAFQAVLGTAGEAVESASSLALNYGRRSTTGVDVRI